MLAAEVLMKVVRAVDQKWRAFKCDNKKRDDGVQLFQTTLGSQGCYNPLKSIAPDVVLRDAWRTARQLERQVMFSERSPFLRQEC